MKKHNADPNHHKPARFSGYVLLVLSTVLGAGSMLILVIFLFSGSLLVHLMDLRMDKMASLGFDAFLCLMFFLQHSLMIRKSYRQWLTQFIRPEYHPALFSIASGIVLLVLLVFWQQTEPLMEPHLLISWFLRGVFFLSLIGFVLMFFVLGNWEPFGIREIIHHMRGTTPPQIPLTLRGPYHWIRHPMYFCMLVMIWSCSNLTADRLLFNVLWTIWMIIGTILEERDHVATFGDDYLAYQRQVPMLIPYRLSLFRKPIEDQ